MAKSQETFNKKEKEKKRRKKRQDKLERQRQRKVEKAERGAVPFEDMISYVDENGNLTSTPPDPAKKLKIKAEDIVLGIPPKEDLPEEEKIRNGRVKFFNEEKGYGFITDLGNNDSHFVHINNIEEAIRENDKVTFEVEMGPKGSNAVNVKLVVPE